MKSIVLAAAAAVALAAPFAQAANASKEELAASCRTQAQDRTGSARKAFIKKCMSNGRQWRAEIDRVCTLDARSKGLQGAERRAFIADCKKQ